MSQVFLWIVQFVETPDDSVTFSNLNLDKHETIDNA